MDEDTIFELMLKQRPAAFSGTASDLVILYVRLLARVSDHIPIGELLEFIDLGSAFSQVVMSEVMQRESAHALLATFCHPK